MLLYAGTLGDLSATLKPHLCTARQPLHYRTNLNTATLSGDRSSKIAVDTLSQKRDCRMDTILVVDDNEGVRKLFRSFLTKKGYEVRTAERGDVVVPEIKKECPDVILLDIKMPGMSGLKLLGEIREAHLEPIVIMFTAYSDMDDIIKAIELGAYDYINKPVDLNDVERTIKEAIERRVFIRDASRGKSEQKRQYPSSYIIGKHPKMCELFKTIGRVASTDTPILIQGETGTGKELIARTIHSHSKRNKKPFVTVDCGTLTETLLESELFGHEKGSFTGAISTKPGLFEVADGGTIFLDEICNMNLAQQGRLLRVLQEHEIRRVGDTSTKKVDIRVIAASSLFISEKIKEGTFSQELYYRLNVVTITVPPLRERKSDIPALLVYFLEKYNTRYPEKKITINHAAAKQLTMYHWPGNVRELENLVEQLCALSKMELITVTDLPETIQHAAAPLRGPSAVESKNLAQLERDHIIQALRAAQGNKSKVAKMLEISRSTLYLKLQAYGLEDASSHTNDTKEK